jgi:RNA polymerase sigma-54 factor
MAEAGLHQSLSQQMRLAPQMQQSLQVLQAATLELRALIQQELNENPVLEMETDEVSLEEQGLDKDGEQDDFNDEFTALAALDDDWREEQRMERKQAASSSDEAGERHQFMMDSLVEPTTLQEHLMEQLGTSSLDVEQREIGELLIGNIDDDGFLNTPVSELCIITGIPLPRLEVIKKLIQSFEPPGVCAQDLRECLLLQLERQERARSLEYRIIDKHIDDLARHRYPNIARKLGITVELVSRAAESIAKLDPRPGQIYANNPNLYITPDVIISRDLSGGELEFTVDINNEQIPHLRISNTYKDIMASGASAETARAYIRDKIRSGKFLIKSIHQRQETIRKIAEELVVRQRDFFARGSSKLHPLTMSAVADAVGVHETTVSRAISGKYMQTPHGVFEMKYFFTPGYQTESGETMSNTSVKQAIADLVKAEPPAKPLSDAAIVKALEEKGIEIARRTVAKYRDELNILPSHLRKAY